MKFKIDITRLKLFIRKHKVPILALIGVIVLFQISAISALAYTLKNDVKEADSTLEAGEQVCEKGRFVLPGWYHIDTGGKFETRFEGTVSVSDRYYLYADEICFTPRDLLEEKESYIVKTSFKGIDYLNKNHTYRVADYPDISGWNEAEVVKLNVNDHLQFQLNKSSEFFEYKLELGDLDVECVLSGGLLDCPLEGLDLTQGTPYTLQLRSYHDGEIVELLIDVNIETLNAVIVTESSVAEGAVTINPKQPVSITFNKDIVEPLQYTWVDEQGVAVEHDVLFESTKLTLTPKADLARLKKYRITITTANGTDGSFLESEYQLNFSVGDGPAISTTNLVETGFSPSGNIVLNFNQSLAPGQNLAQYITINGGTAFTSSSYGYQLTVNPSGSLQYCSIVTLQINPGILNSYGLASSRSYTYNFRVQCGRIASIGTSVGGRSITAHYYGGGPEKIILFGAMHGSELNTRTLLNTFIGELEADPSRIPGDKTIIIIPVLNPDGAAVNRRFNDNGVDLNRNFGSADWQQTTYFAGGTYPIGGGTEPFSEPETRAIRDLIISQAPYLTISYHSAAGYVIPGNTSNSITWAHIYETLSQYQYIEPDDTGAFPYPITGDFTVWAQETGRHTLTIELASFYSSEISRNREAIWRMIEL